MIIIYLIGLILIAGLFTIPKPIILQKLLILITLAAQTSLLVYSYLHLDESDAVYFTFGALGVLLTAVLTILSFATFYHSLDHFVQAGDSKRNIGIYCASLTILIAAMTATYFANTMGVMWASIEATTLSVAVLIYHDRTKISVEATWKYIYISSIGIAIAFIGIMFLSVVVADSGLDTLNIDSIIQVANQLDPIWLKISFVLILTGFSAKMGLFPLHTVCIDAHTVAPPPISAFISTALMNVGFVGIYRIYSIIAQTPALVWANNVLLVMGMLSVLFAASQLVRANHFKRMFAFSSLEHMGLIAICLSMGGVGYYAAILHLILHSFAKSALFYQISQVKQLNDTYSISDSGDYIKRNPTGALIIILSFITISAVPPSGVFYTELLMFKSMFANGHYYIIILLAILLTIIIYAMGKNFLHLLFSPADSVLPADHITPIRKTLYISQFVLLGLVIYLGFNTPEMVTELIQNAIKVIP
jgi:hydrogenase-4 component F